jgi:universal stress protein A
MPDYTRILCAVDYSEPSRRALDCALWWARWHGANLSVLHVHQQATPLVDPSLTGDSGTIDTAAPPVVLPAPLSAQERGAMMDDFVGFVGGRRTDGVEIELLLEEDPSVANTVLARAEALACDLIVMSITGKESAPGQSAVGRETAAVVRGAGCAVLCVPAADGVKPRFARLDRIVCPVSFSDPSRLALAVAGELAAQAAAHLTVMHVVELSEVAASAYDFDAYREERIEPACRQITALVSDAVGEAAAVEEIVVTGAPETEILKTAKHWEADLLVLGAGAAPVAPAAGTTLERVIREAPCPVLVVGGGPLAGALLDPVRAALPVDATP